MPLFHCHEDRQTNHDGSVSSYSKDSSATLEDNGTDLSVSITSKSQNSQSPAHVESAVTSVVFVSNPDGVDKAKGDFFTLDLGDGRSLVLSPVNDFTPYFELTIPAKNTPLLSSFNCTFEPATLEVLKIRSEKKKGPAH